jgi:hypothetical protein
MVIWYVVPRKIWQPWTEACIIFLLSKKALRFDVENLVVENQVVERLVVEKKL